MNRPAKEFYINSSRLYPLQTVLSRAHLYASATVAQSQYQYLLINVDSLPIFAATLLCSKMSFGTRTSLCLQPEPPSIRFALRVSVFCLVNNLNEGEEGEKGRDNRVAVSLCLCNAKILHGILHIPSR